MGKVRGLSLQEKRDKVMAIFTEPGALFFNEKEIAQLAVKRGVRDGPDILKTLVDDDLVTSDKVGVSRYFWHLPSEAEKKLRTRKRKAEAATEEREATKKRHVEATAALRAERAGGDEREAGLKELAELKSKEAALLEELSQFAAVDPEKLAEIRKARTEALIAANRWTDNIFSIQSYLRNKFSMERRAVKEVCKQAGVPDDLDNIDVH